MNKTKAKPTESKIVPRRPVSAPPVKQGTLATRLQAKLGRANSVTGGREVGTAKLPTGVYTFEQLLDVAAYLEQFR